MFNRYTSASEPDGHDWSVTTDLKKQQVFQACSCGWKTRVRDFYGPASTYDLAYQWMNHFEVKLRD